MTETENVGPATVADRPTQTESHRPECEEDFGRAFDCRPVAGAFFIGPNVSFPLTGEPGG